MQACIDVVMVIAMYYQVYNNDISMAMVHVLFLDDLVASKMFLSLYYHRMLRGDSVLAVSGYAVSQGTAVYVPVRGSTVFRMLHATVSCTTDLPSAVFIHTIMTI